MRYRCNMTTNNIGSIDALQNHAPLLKCYGNQPSAILNGASVNNHCVHSAVYKFGGDSSSNRAVYVNNRLRNCSRLQD